MRSYPFSRFPVVDLPGDYEELRAQGSVVRVSHLGTPVWLTLGQQETRKVLTDPRFSRARLRPERPGETPAFAEMLKYDSVGLLGDADQPDHRRLRKALTLWFTNEYVERLRPEIARLFAAQLDRDSPADFLNDVARPFVDQLQFRLLWEMCGVPPSGRNEAYRWMQHLFKFDLNTSQEEIQAIAQRCDEYFQSLIQARREAPGDDPLSIALTDPVFRAATNQELAWLLLGIIRGGYNTTPTVLSHCVWLLLRNPAWWEKLVLDHSLIPQAAEEALRLQPPAERNGMRRALEDVVVGDVTIRTGDVVIPGSMPASYDPDHFTDPAQFDPLRPNSNQHFSFGHGPHFCPGAAMGRYTVIDALTVLVTRFPGLRLAGEPSWLPNDHMIPMRTFDSLPVAW
ncbi:biflaviolin synthase CYP158A2 [Lentzea sp. NBRC 105346]|uniref:cytochrome P450 n=1 Tax=Lentzea sp. NBRC 105346 TaxID=3032205 RepID=UPI0024A162C2|nr:cytochrome P450 [Lentzea sp. NBRC 105346]GLZ31341.1 biflaviolin synthase CYP158A2 [Lentzea sp. NBRC 105346]